MINKSLSSMLVPAAGVTLGAFLTLYVVKDQFTEVPAPPCSGRYPSATEFSLKSADNGPMSAIEFQALAGANEWGVLENASVQAASDAPAPLVLKVNLPKDSTSLYKASGNGGGLTFRWQPNGFAGASAACLRYSIFVPDTFDFGSGGELPGIYGGKDYQPATPADGTNVFAARLKWTPDGDAAVSVQMPDESGRLLHTLSEPGIKLGRNRWIAIEQETILNTPGKRDGWARLCVNGTLASETKRLVWRQDQSLTMSGVSHDVWYGGLDNPATAPSATYLAFTPMSVSWK